MSGTAGQRQGLVLYHLPGSTNAKKPGDKHGREAEHLFAPSGQRLLDAGLDFILRNQPSGFRDNLSVPADKVGGRQEFDAAILARHGIVAHQQWVVEALLLAEFCQLGSRRIGIILRDTENFKALRGILVRKATSQGISILQGAHQVAQKLINTALPL